MQRLQKISYTDTVTAKLYIDARMLFSSGIGRYQREILSRWSLDQARNEHYFCSTGEQVEWLEQRRPGAKISRTTAGIYSLREQALAWNLPASAVLWVPHYNLPWLTRAHIVATVHDVAPLALKHVFDRPAQQWAAKFYFGAARCVAKRVITVSQFSADELHRLAGVPRARLQVIPNGVGPEWFLPAEPAVVRSTHRLLFVGNLKPHKNLARLIEALELMRARRLKNVELDIVGQIDGFRTGLEAAFATKLYEAPWIHLHGSIDDRTLGKLYQSVTALVFPSLYEGFGLPMLEAMASGCPVLAAAGSSLSEIGGPVAGNESAVTYFDPLDPVNIADTIALTLQLPQGALDDLGQRGRIHARQFTWDRAARDTLAVLKLAQADASGISHTDRRTVSPSSL